MFSSIKKVIRDARKGKLFILVDDKNRENEGDLVVPAKKITPKKINFMSKYARGLICLALDEKKTKDLNLSLMPKANASRFDTAFTVSIEARKGVTTGISAYDRAKTIKVAIKKNSTKKDISTPGHIFPLVARSGGVLERAGHTEASVDISKLSNCGPSAVICEILNEDGSMARMNDLKRYSKKFNLNIASIEDLIAYRLTRETLIKYKRSEIVEINKKNKYQIKIFDNLIDKKEHLALLKNFNPRLTPRVRVVGVSILKSLISKNIDNRLINKTLEYFNKYNNCVLIIIKDEQSKNTKKFNNKSKNNLIKNYGIGAQIIKYLKIKKLILVTRSKKKLPAWNGFGIKIVKQEIIK